MWKYQYDDMYCIVCDDEKFFREFSSYEEEEAYAIMLRRKHYG